MSEPSTLVAVIPAGLTVRGLGTPYPVADWLCACGHHERATGAPAVRNLAANVVVGHCPHERSAAA
ncbi:hypothetical protein [Streptomyces sp. NPDC093676]|uniref:hypothetical protein n=1 Tax=Streptomyces sp. NPDC093676 TaxID=3366050 RepID=UPI00382FF90E